MPTTATPQSTPAAAPPPSIHREKRVIAVPESGAFNGALLPVDGGFLMVYRPSEECLAACRLTQDYALERQTHVRLNIWDNVDPRLFADGPTLFMSTSYAGEGWARERAELWVIRQLEPRIALGPRISFAGVNRDPAYQPRREKNWTPFIHGGHVYFVHQLMPLRILKVDFTTGAADLVYQTEWSASHWLPEWGEELRGSTAPALLADGTFLTTFHTVGPAGHYTGFIRFEGAPPFAVLSVSRQPVLTPDDASGVSRIDPRIALVFVHSLQVEGELIRLGGGDNDKSIVVFHLPLAEVLDQMIPCDPPRRSDSPAATLH